MKDGDTIWVCGKYEGTFEGTKQTATAWEIGGVFTSEELAVKACHDRLYFVGPLKLNEVLPDGPSEWPGAYYPYEGKGEKK